MTTPHCIPAFPGIAVDLAARTVSVGGQRVHLTHKEFDLLAVLTRWVGSTVSREAIVREVWGTTELAEAHSLDVHLASLAVKLDCPELLTSIGNLRYQLA